MLLFFLMMSWVLSTIFMFLNHPLSFGFILLIQTIIVCFSTGMFNLDFWFSYILFLIMIGGMLVLFIYMTSVVSNEKFSNPQDLWFLLGFTFIITMILYMMFDTYSMTMEMYIHDYMNQSSINHNNLSYNKYMNKPSNWVMSLLLFYLLFTLIAIVKITKTDLGPLRQKM